MTWWLRIAACLVVLALAACDRYPRDPQDTLARVQGQVLRIGIAPDPPFVVLAPGQPPRGAEIALIEAWAEALDARVLWVEGAHDALMEDLEAFRLHAVVGGLAADTPWKTRVGLSRPFHLHAGDGLHDRVLAVPPGENAWLLHFETFVRSPRAARLLAPQAP
ncbi:MAG: ABC transporter substrate-binding protein [Pseudomonadota bacterium]|nr:ABC transporter substrate-binding protein [Pseudomonadota bacterium]